MSYNFHQDTLHINTNHYYIIMSYNSPKSYSLSVTLITSLCRMFFTKKLTIKYFV